MLPKVTKKDLANPVPDSTERISWYKIAVDRFLYANAYLKLPP